MDEIIPGKHINVRFHSTIMAGAGDPAIAELERTRDQFDTLYQEGAKSARVMAIATHPFVTGAAHRIGYFDKIFQHIKKHKGVRFMTGSEILDWYKSVAS